jgi:hypothetical protein
VKKGNPDSFGERLERSPELCADAGSLEEDAPKFFEDGRAAVDLVEDLATPGRALQNSGRCQRLELPGNRARRSADDAGELPHIERFVWMHEQPAQQPPARLAEKYR